MTCKLDLSILESRRLGIKDPTVVVIIFISNCMSFFILNSSYVGQNLVIHHGILIRLQLDNRQEK
jgi:hypothetical protein